MDNVFLIDKEYVANTYARFPVQIVSGKGSTLKDVNGKKYIDMGTGIGVTALGTANRKWKKAVKSQINRFQHVSNLYYSEPCALLAKTLVERTGLKKVFFSNSGAEANECAIKVCRKYGVEKKGVTAFNIITLKNSFHGRTITTLSATGQDCFHKDFTPLTEGFSYANANDFESVKALVNKNTVAIMIELVQGEGGVVALEQDFVTKIDKLCKEKDILLVVDEVQTGNGRTGKLYSYMHYGILPDVVTTAKGLGGGLPIGACIMGEKVEKTLSFGDHGSTYGGNPVACAGALAVLGELNETFLDNVNKKSQYIFNSLKDAKGVVSVTGKGLMIGIKTEKDARTVVNECLQRGVLCLTAKDKIRLLPALNISQKQLEKAINVIKEVIGKE